MYVCMHVLIVDYPQRFLDPMFCFVFTSTIFLKNFVDDFLHKLLFPYVIEFLYIISYS